MRNFPYAGPGFVVLAAAAAALLAAPFAIRRANDAQADSNILRAKHVLEGDGLAVREVIDEVPLLEQINRANRAIAKLVEPSVVHVSTMMTQERRNFSAPYMLLFFGGGGGRGEGPVRKGRYDGGLCEF